MVKYLARKYLIIQKPIKKFGTEEVFATEENKLPVSI
jgi:hypothetical protein